MRLKDDVYYLQQEVGDIRQESFAMELIRESNAENKLYEKQNKRLFIITVLAMLLLAVTFGYLVYILTDIEVEEITTEESYDVDQDSGDNGNNNFVNGNENNVNNG